jgi:hypothetical protein
MSADGTRVMEHLATACPLSLRDLCDAMQSHFGLPAFEFDAENETEWGSAVREGIEYNVSRPYEPGTLQQWDDSVPAGCNFGITLALSNGCPPHQDAQWSLNTLTPDIGQRLADLVQSPVCHHRTWLGVGQNVARHRVFRPTAE